MCLSGGCTPNHTVSLHHCLNARAFMLDFNSITNYHALLLVDKLYSPFLHSIVPSIRTTYIILVSYFWCMLMHCSIPCRSVGAYIFFFDHHFTTQSILSLLVCENEFYTVIFFSVASSFLDFQNEGSFARRLWFCVVVNMQPVIWIHASKLLQLYICDSDAETKIFIHLPSEFRYLAWSR